MPESRCAYCDAAVDALRSVAIVVEGRVVSLCRDCNGTGAAVSRQPVFLPEHDPWRRCRCGRPMSPGTARTEIVDGAVELRCGSCDRPSPGPPPPPRSLTSPVAEPWLHRRHRIPAIAAALVGLGALTAIAATGDDVEIAGTLALSSPNPLAAVDVDAEPMESPNLSPPEPEPVPAAEEPIEQTDVAEIDFIELGPEDVGRRAGDIELGPADGDVVDHDSLADWTHPIAGARAVVPTAPSREFGAERPGNRPSECGGGHCGVDLGGEVGVPVVSVRAGVVVWIEHRANRSSGRYVRVRHSGGVVTWYMHLHEIAEGLDVGTPVKAGQRLGSLGKSGIRSSQPHLHFSVQAPTDAGGLRYVDPAPALGSATVVDPLDVIEPASGHEL